MTKLRLWDVAQFGFFLAVAAYFYSVGKPWLSGVLFGTVVQNLWDRWLRLRDEGKTWKAL